MLGFATATGPRMRLNNIPFLIVFIVMHECFGDIHLTCNTVDQMLPSTITCTCRYENGKGILWYINNKHIADCYLRTEVCLSYNGHSISVNRSEKTYTISKTSYNYSSCDVYTCRDFNQPEINASQRITVHDLCHEDLEAVWCELLLRKSRPILCGALYRPPSQSNFYSVLETVCSSTTDFSSLETVILGDLNTNVCKSNRKCFLFESLRNFMNMFHFKQHSCTA